MSRVVVLTGPARSGKTEQLLQRYRQALAAPAAGSTLWIAPTYRSVADIQQRLLSPELPACFSPGVVTFDGFARQALQASGQVLRPVTPLMKQQLLRTILDELSQQGELRYFTPIVGTAGLLEQVSAQIADLKRLEIWPENLQDACQRRGGLRPKDRDLLTIYQSYQNRLLQHELYDVEGSFWAALNVLRSGAMESLNRLRLAVFDGFTDFTRTQHDILREIAARVEELVVSLPLDEESGRSELFSKTLETREILLRLPGAVEERRPRQVLADWPAMSGLERELFENPLRPGSDVPMERIEVVAASSVMAEIDGIGRRIKQLLLQGDPDEPERKISPADVAVVFRTCGPAAPLIREVFGELGLPVSVESSPPLIDAPPARALLALLEMTIEDWPFRQLIAVLGNGYFRPRWEECRGGRGAEAAVRWIRRLQIPAGRRELLEALATAERQLTERLKQVEGEAGGASSEDHDVATPAAGAEESGLLVGLKRELDELQQATAYLKKWEAACRLLPSSARLDHWNDAVLALAEECGLVRGLQISDDRRLIEHDQATWNRIVAALQSGTSLFELLDEAPPELSAHEYRTRLSEWLAQESTPQDFDETGRIRVLNAASLRTLRVPYLFFAGLTERSFPAPGGDAGIYDDGEGQALARAGDLPWPDRTEHCQREMLLFYETITRATRRLWLSYPALDPKAQPLLPSPYLEEVQRASGGVPRLQQLDLTPVPREDATAPLSRRSLRLHAIESALSGDVEKLSLLRQGDSTPLWQNLIDGLAVVRQRSDPRAFGPYEGLILGPLARADLAVRFGAERCFNITELESYASCPFRYLMERVLRLQPLDEMELLGDVFQRGHIAHAVLARLHARLNELRAGPTSPTACQEAALKELQTALEELAPLPPDDAVYSQAAEALRELDHRRVRQWLDKYLEQHAKYDGLEDQPPLRPAHFELAFGRPPRDGSPSLPPLKLQRDGDAIQLSGRIDRVDLGGDDGQVHFAVIDYKSGRNPKAVKGEADVDGTALQVELYAIAVQELLFGPESLPVGGGYWAVAASGYKRYLDFAEQVNDRWTASPTWVRRRGQAIAKVFELVAGIRRGEFPMASVDKECTSRCNFSHACRVSHVRALEKPWPPLPPT